MTTLPGRRLPVREDGTYDLPREPGDYVGPILVVSRERGPAQQVFFLLPGSRDEDAPLQLRALHGVQSPPHGLVEEDDGSLTIVGSIGASRQPDGSFLWHGYLERGTWRTV